MPKYDYDVVVIGGGAGGLTASGICASFGAKTALIERHRLGGDCTWTGCVPSKALLHIAKEIVRIQNIGALGVECQPPTVDFARVMQSVRATRQHIYEDADSPELMAKRGVEVFEGTAGFRDSHSIDLSTNGQTRSISFRSAIITAGGTSLVIPIKGLDQIEYLTNDTLFEIESCPEHLVILGNGPIGIEMAQAFNTLGSKVSVIGLDEHLLIRDEPRCAELIHTRLAAQGVIFCSGQTIHEITKSGSAYQFAVGPISGATTNITGDTLLVAIGRKPMLEALKLENAGVKFEKSGIPVDKHCRTNRKHIFAAGDVTTFMKFTHVAENMGKTAAINAVMRLPLYSHEQHLVPWVTYTDPECAHIGSTAGQLRARNVKFDTIEFPYGKIDRAVTEHADEGHIIIHANPNGKILGAHAVGVQAGEIISEYTLAMKNGLKLSNISDTVHAYPTMLLGARRAADQYYVRLQKRWMATLVKKIFRYQGEIPDSIGSNEVM